jgi:hypothetical protein
MDENMLVSISHDLLKIIHKLENGVSGVTRLKNKLSNDQTRACEVVRQDNAKQQQIGHGMWSPHWAIA